jgi:ABC-2 type transport system ATP-binding protein
LRQQPTLIRTDREGNVIEVRNLTKRYGERVAVRDLSFEVARGEVVGFLGPNGAGKSTTLRMLTGFLEPTEGEIRVNGFDARRQALELKRSIGYMPEAVPLYLDMRVVEYLRFRAELKGVARRQIEQNVDRALELASVADVKTRIIGQLSKGYRQRVGLADALVADPPLLILDEPTAGLDPNQIRQVRDLVRALSREKTVLLSTHILPEVEAICARVVIIDRGRLVSIGRPEELRGGSGAITLERSRASCAARSRDSKACAPSRSISWVKCSVRASRSAQMRIRVPSASSARSPTRGSICASCAARTHRSKTCSRV